MDPWKLPLLILAIAVPIVAAFAAGGPGAGMAVGAAVAVAIVVLAVRQRPRGAIVATAAAGDDRHLLLVISRPLEEPAALRRVAARIAGGEGEGVADVLVLAPVSIGFLDRWASDLEPARREAQRRLVITVASLAKAGVAAEARVGDEDLVQAVEDQLRSFPATEVVLVSGGQAEDPAGCAAAMELRARLRAGFDHVVVRDPTAR